MKTPWWVSLLWYAWVIIQMPYWFAVWLYLVITGKAKD